MTHRAIEVSPDLSGERADKIIAACLGLSRSEARSIIDAGDALVGDRRVKASDKLAVGTSVALIVPETDTALVPDDTVPFSVRYEDEFLAVVDKPIGVVVHPGSGRSSGTLANGLLARYPEIDGVGAEGRFGIVHRLDRDTSGLLVVARTHDAHEMLTQMLKDHSVSRRYLALVQHGFTNTTGTVDAPVGRDAQNRTKMRVSRDGRSSITHYRQLATWDGFDASLLSVTLETGRTHQIRVHMRAIDHPIIGDSVYGRRAVVGDPGRPWLHARQLTFEHPQTSALIDIVSPLPQDLSDSLVALGNPDRGETVDVIGEHL
jgi:23S rRNA pseudouridine1911/1915/1917 synthase